MKIKTLLVDDEKLARQELRFLLQEFPNVEIVGEAQNADEAVELAREHKPDLLFLDINMPEKSGFDLLEELDEAPEVVFVTAYDQYAIQAFDTNALDYILKPVKPDRLQKAIEKVSEALANKPKRDRTADLKPDSQVFIKDGEKCFFVKLSDIFMFESAGNYVKVHFGQKAPLLHKSLNLLETKLPQDMFFRANRKEMINMTYIQNIESYFKGGLHVTLKSGHNVEVSTRQAVRFKELMSL